MRSSASAPAPSPRETCGLRSGCKTWTTKLHHPSATQQLGPTSGAFARVGERAGECTGLRPSATTARTVPCEREHHYSAPPLRHQLESATDQFAPGSAQLEAARADHGDSAEHDEEPQLQPSATCKCSSQHHALVHLPHGWRLTLRASHFTTPHGSRFALRT